MATPQSKLPTKANIEYEGTDLTPVYVEAAQGIKTPRGAFQLSFYSEFIKSRDRLGARIEPIGEHGNSTTVRMNADDPYGLSKGEPLKIVRRIEANLILTIPALRSIIPWLQSKLKELEEENK